MALIKLKLMHFRIFVLILVLLLGAWYINTTGFKLIQRSGDTTFQSILKGAPANLVSYDDYQACKEVKEQKITIQCKADPSVTEPQSLTLTINTPIPADDKYKSDGTAAKFRATFFNNLQGGFVQSIGSTIRNPTYLQTRFIDVVDASSGDLICSAAYERGILGLVGGADLCSSVTQLTKGKTYYIYSDFDSATITMSGTAGWLFYSNPDVGQIDIRLPGTENCAYAQWQTAVKTYELANDISLTDTGTTTTIANNGVPVTDPKVKAEIETPGSVSQPFLENPTVFTEVPSPTNPEERTVALALGVTWTAPYAFVEKSYIINPLNYNGYLADCRIAEEKVVGYYMETITGKDVCYYRSDSSATLLSKNDVTGKFCCRTSDCLPIGPDYSCSGYSCKKDAPPDDNCIGDDQCPDQYYTRGDGKSFFRDGYCNMALSPKTCAYKDYAIQCNPESTYPQGSCCKDLGTGQGWQLYTGETCGPVGPTDCATAWGTNACCLSSQKTYTVQACSPELECCGAETDGLGVCKSTCEEVRPSLWDQFLTALQSILGTTPQVAIIIAIILVIIGLIFLLKALFPRFGAPPLIGTGLGGAGGVSGGGTSVIIVER